MAKNNRTRKTKKDNSLRNAIITFGVSLLGYASLFRFHKLSDFLIGGGIALIAASLIKVMTTPLKGLNPTDHSDQLDPENVEDEYARNTIVRGLELLSELRAERDAINEYVFTRRLNDLASSYAELLNKVVANHDKATHLRKLNSYYIPTAVKLLQSYREAKSAGTSYMEIQTTRDNILKSLDQLISATNTLRKKMLKSNLESIDIKVEVLEDILKADGYIEDEQTAAMRKSAESAARQIPLSQQTTPGARPAARPAAKPVQQLQPVQPRPAAKPAARPAASAIPVQMTEEAAEPRPTIKVSMPTASARSLDEGAPVLQVPGMLDFETADEDDEASSRR
ncbi:MAG: hypothetical protein E7327_05690 [Clostridiales bacterium]|nr:hypothetical protein [Clostridiales bacterium]